MCSRDICHSCKKYTWSSCGEHIGEALAGVPQDKPKLDFKGARSGLVG